MVFKFSLLIVIQRNVLGKLKRIRTHCFYFLTKNIQQDCILLLIILDLPYVL